MPEPTPPENQPPAVRVNALVERAIQRHGSAENALSVLMAQNVTLEDQAGTDRETIAQLRRQVPDPEKVVVLPKERAELFNKFETLKLTPEQITAALTERDDLKAKDQTYSLEKLAREGAPAFGYDPDATADLITSKQLRSELREVEVEVEKAGKKEKVKQKHIYVRPAADDRAPFQSLTEYAKALPAFEQRALKAATTESTTTNGGTPYVEQRPAGTPAPTDAVAEHIRKQSEHSRTKPSPFVPRPAAAPAVATP